MKQQAIAHQFSGVADVVTVSLGVATRQGEGSASATAADLLALADAQLYHAKHAGRAQACGAVLQPVVAAP